MGNFHALCECRVGKWGVAWGLRVPLSRSGCPPWRQVTCSRTPSASGQGTGNLVLQHSCWSTIPQVVMVHGFSVTLAACVWRRRECFAAVVPSDSAPPRTAHPPDTPRGRHQTSSGQVPLTGELRAARSPDGVGNSPHKPLELTRKQTKCGIMVRWGGPRSGGAGRSRWRPVWRVGST